MNVNGTPKIVHRTVLARMQLASTRWFFDPDADDALCAKWGEQKEDLYRASVRRFVSTSARISPSSRSPATLN